MATRDDKEAPLNQAAAIEAVQAAVGYRFKTPELLRSALTHASIASSRLASNERMEFLGDAVLGLVICEELYARFPKYLEGEMTRIKSVVVSRETCATVAERLDLMQHLSLGKGITESETMPASLAACGYEAIIGAIYLDGGLEPARRFILAHMDDQIDRVLAGEHRRNYKSLLQQHAQRDLGASPNYEVLDEKGPDHAKAFEVAVTIRGRRYPSAWGPSKKSAEQRAAREALTVLGQLEAETVPVDPAADDQALPPPADDDETDETDNPQAEEGPRD
ncbi:MAG: ribonuclease III [Planctomycetes bacterium]|nr:ribonuclease III [Planctomycetota bacterium]